MISLKKINKQVVKAIPIPSQLDQRPIKGFDICEELYANIFIPAKKKSGKTSTVFKIMKECADKKTIIVVFCSTSYKDENWIEVRSYFENKGNDIRVYTSLYEEGEDQLENLINQLNQEAQDQEMEAEDKEDKVVSVYDRLKNLAFGDDEQEKKKKCKKCKYRCCEYMFIFDDLSSELKSKSLLTLLKKNRHYRSKIIISSQWLHDLLPESRKQLDLFLVFKGFPEKKLMEIYRDCDSSVPFETFYALYLQATKKPHSFFYIDTRSDTFRSNFDHQFMLNNEHSEN